MRPLQLGDVITTLVRVKNKGLIGGRYLPPGTRGTFRTMGRSNRNYIVVRLGDNFYSFDLDKEGVTWARRVTVIPIDPGQMGEIVAKFTKG